MLLQIPGKIQRNGPSPEACAGLVQVILNTAGDPGQEYLNLPSVEKGESALDIGRAGGNLLPIQACQAVKTARRIQLRSAAVVGLQVAEQLQSWSSQTHAAITSKFSATRPAAVYFPRFDHPCSPRSTLCKLAKPSKPPKAYRSKLSPATTASQRPQTVSGNFASSRPNTDLGNFVVVRAGLAAWAHEAAASLEAISEALGARQEKPTSRHYDRQIQTVRCGMVGVSKRS